MKNINDISSTNTSSSTYSSIMIERLLIGEPEESSSEGYQLSQQQLMINEFAPRVTGAIAFICAVCMIYMAWKRKDRVFHRLVLGMAVHALIEGAFLIYGPAAIPNDSTNALTNVGTTLTCSIQGFFIFFCGLSSTLYYASFSAYSLVGILCNFNKIKYQWIEKWLHIGVHIYPMSTGIYGLYNQGFNNSGYGFCYGAGSPLECEKNRDILCERGQKFNDMYLPFRKFLLSMTLILEIFVPTIVMATLYCIVKHRPQGQIHISTEAIAMQSVIYLIALYWTILPLSISSIIGGFTLQQFEYVYPYTVFGMLNYSLFGLWSLLSYFYFSVKNTNTKSTAIASTGGTATAAIGTTNEDVTAQTENNEFIFGSQEIEIQGNNPTSTRPVVDTTTTIPPPIAAVERNYSFNIFDGTNASGKFAEFVHDGDSEDERNDNEQTVHWGGDVQNHI